MAMMDPSTAELQGSLGSVGLALRKKYKERQAERMPLTPEAPVEAGAMMPQASRTQAAPGGGFMYGGYLQRGVGALNEASIQGQLGAAMSKNYKRKAPSIWNS